MKTSSDILLEFLFPKFSRPPSSRFLSSFASPSKEKDFPNKKVNKSIVISIDKKREGDDKRTSVMIKNLPLDVTKMYINEMLRGVGNINYLYLPHEKYTNKCLGFAFVNVVNYKNIIRLYNKVNGVKLEKFEMKRPLEICYSIVQGKAGLAEMFGKK